MYEYSLKNINVTMYIPQEVIARMLSEMSSAGWRLHTSYAVHDTLVFVWERPVVITQ